MAPATNWLSFSLSPMEMMRSSQTQFLSYDDAPSSAASASASVSASATHYLIDNFYADGWSNQKSQMLFTEAEEKGGEAPPSMAAGSPNLTTFMEPPQNQTNHSSTVPKLEDFLGDSLSSQMARYSESQTETQDSSLTQIYNDQTNQTSTYFNDHHQQQQHHHQDLKSIAGFQAFSGANSGSEVDDSMARTHLGGSEFHRHSIESAGNELAFSTCPTGALSLAVNNNNHNQTTNHNKTIISVDSDCSKKIADTFGQRTSIYRGVTRHRWTGRYEAHLWDNSCRREGQARKGRQVYLGGYDKEDKAARAYDLAALKYWGPSATTNFPTSNYAKELEEMKHATKQEFIASLRRKSSGFSRGASIYRGVTRHHQQGRWQARIGRVAGNKDLYLGTFATEEEAAEAYDIAAIKFRGVNAVTNFEMNRYDVEAITKSSLPIGGAAKRLKLSLEAEQKQVVVEHHHHLQQHQQQQYSNNNISFSSIPCGIPYETGTTTAATTASSGSGMYHHQSLFHHYQQMGGTTSNDHSSTSSSAMAAQMNLLPNPPEFYLWPNQNY